MTVGTLLKRRVRPLRGAAQGLSQNTGASLGATSSGGAIEASRGQFVRKLYKGLYAYGRVAFKPSIVHTND